MIYWLWLWPAGAAGVVLGMALAMLFRSRDEYIQSRKPRVGSKRLDYFDNTSFIVGDFVVRAYFKVDNKYNDVVDSVIFTSLREEDFSRYGVNTLRFTPIEFNKLMNKAWPEYLALNWRSPSSVDFERTDFDKKREI